MARILVFGPVATCIVPFLHPVDDHYYSVFCLQTIKNIEAKKLLLLPSSVPTIEQPFVEQEDQRIYNPTIPEQCEASPKFK